MKHHIIVDVPDPKPNTMAAVFAAIGVYAKSVNNEYIFTDEEIMEDAFNKAEAFMKVMRRRKLK